MKNEHLTSFRVENFKKFDALELTDIGQFNLFVGDNNVGKTSLLESIAVFGSFSLNPDCLSKVFN
ncbi:MAG: AAA family ATPase, partial [Saprospiraceae bacterium]|nr:AAA family ATPase [Saprospiraceae bacterium]